MMAVKAVLTTILDGHAVTAGPVPVETVVGLPYGGDAFGDPLVRVTAGEVGADAAVLLLTPGATLSLVRELLTTYEAIVPRGSDDG